jgi:hypothetical protein
VGRQLRRAPIRCHCRSCLRSSTKRPRPQTSSSKSTVLPNLLTPFPLCLKREESKLKRRRKEPSKRNNQVKSKKTLSSFLRKNKLNSRRRESRSKASRLSKLSRIRLKKVKHLEPISRNSRNKKSRRILGTALSGKLSIKSLRISMMVSKRSSLGFIQRLALV